MARRSLVHYFIACAIIALQLYSVEHVMESHSDGHAEFCEVCAGLSSNDESIAKTISTPRVQLIERFVASSVNVAIHSDISTALIRAPPAPTNRITI